MSLEPRACMSRPRKMQHAMNEHGHGADSHMRGSARRRMPLKTGTHQTPLPRGTRVTSADPLLWLRSRAAHLRLHERGAASRRAPCLCMPKIPAPLHPVRLLKMSAAAVVLPGARALLVRAAVRRVAQRQLRLELAACQRRAPTLHLHRAHRLAKSFVCVKCICAFVHVSRITQKAVWGCTAVGLLASGGCSGVQCALYSSSTWQNLQAGRRNRMRTHVSCVRHTSVHPAWRMHFNQAGSPPWACWERTQAGRPGQFCLHAHPAPAGCGRDGGREGGRREGPPGAPAARARPGPCRRWGRRASARSARRSAART